MIIPSIDLISGKAVQLKQGREKMLERDAPLELAKNFDRFGEIAVIDLDAAMKNGDNIALIREICKIADCRVGGGINSVARAKEMISYGARKIIIGTKAFENDVLNHDFLESLANAIGKEHLMIAIDAFGREIVTHAWKHHTGLNLFDVIQKIEPYVSEFLFTCVEREGHMKGTDITTIKALKNLTKKRLTVAGGISTIQEIRELSSIGVNMQLGMAIYTQKLTLEDAFIESLNWNNSLIPTITCDDTGQVLMLAYSNKESLLKTFRTGNMWYFSRSRNKLWMKGETSGHLQKFVHFRTDCDSDSLLATVAQIGSACHFEDYSCFGDKKFGLHELYAVIQNRIHNPSQGSYTATLTDELVRKKILEEAQEIVEAKNKDEITWEAADVLYFLMVLLAKSGIDVNDVMHELNRRRKK